MRRIAAAALVLTVLLLLLLGIAQLVLPGIAAQSLRDRFARSGQVLQVRVQAFPAIELLWGHADSVVVRLGRYRATSGGLGSLLDQAGNVGSLHASATEIHAGLLTLRNAALEKRGNVVSGHAEVTEADLRSAFPVLQSVTPVASGGGQLTLRGTATLFGVSATVDAVVRALGGALVVAPQVPLGSLPPVTVFANPHVAVLSVGASRNASGFAVTGTARLR